MGSESVLTARRLLHAVSVKPSSPHVSARPQDVGACLPVSVLPSLTWGQGLSSEKGGPPTGADKDWGPLPMDCGHSGSEGSPHLSQAQRFLGCPPPCPGEMGVPGACGLGYLGSGWRGTRREGCPPPSPSTGLSLPLSPPCLPWGLPSALPFAPSSHPSPRPHHLPAQTSTSARRTASSVGPARCALTPVAATSVWTRRVPPPTGRAPAQGKG